MTAGGITGILNLLFNVVVARGGGVSSYGAIGPLLTLGTVAGLLATGLQYGVARVAALAPKPAREMVRPAFRSVLPWVLPTLILALLAVPISRFLHLSSPLPVLIVTVLAASSVAAAAVGGLLIGLRRFRVIASLGIAFATLRLVLGFVLGRGGGAVDGSIVASLIPILGSMLLGLAILLHWSRPSDRAGVSDRIAGSGGGIGHTGFVGALIAGAMWTIWGMPVLFARHALSSVTAGDFAASQLLAGGIIWVTAPLITAFYPTIVRHRNRSPIAIGAIATVAIALLGLATLTAVGPVLIDRLYGGQFSASRGTLFILTLSATATACAAFACWAALARKQAMRLTLALLVLALLIELVWDALASTETLLAAGPLLALALSGGTIGTAAFIFIRRAGASAPEDSEPSAVGRLSSQVRSDP